MAGGFYAAFPDLHVSLEGKLIGEDDCIASRYTWSGTHQGAFMGIPATQRRVAVVGTNIFRIDGERIVEQWETQDVAGLLQQLSASEDVNPR
jgi:predicted ester cyclase